MKVYLAGPMRGLPNCNFPAFYAAEQRWREAGHTAFNPARLYDALGYSIDDKAQGPLRHIMTFNLTCLFYADAIALLPGWSASIGTTVELATAHMLGLKVMDAITQQPMSSVERLPWDRLATTLARMDELEQIVVDDARGTNEEGDTR